MEKGICILRVIVRLDFTSNESTIMKVDKITTSVLANSVHGFNVNRLSKKDNSEAARRSV